jgi:ATP-dependent Clp protease ATP-binding subunit ClpB
LIGTPPGYIGYEEAGLLTESVRRRPYQILLFDEFEKAHRDVWNILLQLFDEGYITDAHGRKVDFRNVLVLMTSNIGGTIISELPEHMKGSEPEVYNAIMDMVRSTMSPELFNRIDETIIFHRLQREHLEQITDLRIEEIKKRLEDNQNMVLHVTTNAKKVLSEQGFDIRYGARPLKRVINRTVLNPLSKVVLEKSIQENEIVYVCTRAEAEKEQHHHQQQQKPNALTRFEHGWVSSNPLSQDRNDIVIIRNHPPAQGAVVINDVTHRNPRNEDGRIGHDDGS